MKKIQATVILCIYNEEKIIERALESVKDFGQIIVIHDGKCIDRSLEIAKKYTNDVYELGENKGACDYNRIYGFERAIFDWILILDADEYLSDELKVKIPELILSKDVAIYNVNWPIRDGTQYHFGIGSYKRVLFNKNDVYFIGAMNEYIKLLNTSKTIRTIDEVLYHCPLYVNVSWRTFITKQKKWAKMQANDFIVPFDSLNKWNYTKKERDFFNKYRMRFPILLGMIGSFLFQILRGGGLYI